MATVTTAIKSVVTTMLAGGCCCPQPSGASGASGSGGEGPPPGPPVLTFCCVDGDGNPIPIPRRLFVTLQHLQSGSDPGCECYIGSYPIDYDDIIDEWVVDLTGGDCFGTATIHISLACVGGWLVGYSYTPSGSAGSCYEFDPVPCFISVSCNPFLLVMSGIVVSGFCAFDVVTFSE